MRAAMRPGLAPWTIKYRADSRSLAMRMITIARGKAPPTKKTDRHPQSGSRAEATSPPSTAPSGIPVNSIETKIAWRRFGEYSAVRATTFGIAPPSPTPVRKRNSSNSLNEET
jgi:hypothetical protein